MPGRCRASPAPRPGCEMAGRAPDPAASVTVRLCPPTVPCRMPVAPRGPRAGPGGARGRALCAAPRTAGLQDAVPAIRRASAPPIGRRRRWPAPVRPGRRVMPACAAPAQAGRIGLGRAAPGGRRGAPQGRAPDGSGRAPEPGRSRQTGRVGSRIVGAGDARADGSRAPAGLAGGWPLGTRAARAGGGTDPGHGVPIRVTGVFGQASAMAARPGEGPVTEPAAGARGRPRDPDGSPRLRHRAGTGHGTGVPEGRAGP